jgi:hypothetical protein
MVKVLRILKFFCKGPVFIHCLGHSYVEYEILCSFKRLCVFRYIYIYRTNFSVTKCCSRCKSCIYYAAVIRHTDITAESIG